MASCPASVGVLNLRRRLRVPKCYGVSVETRMLGERADDAFREREREAEEERQGGKSETERETERERQGKEPKASEPVK